MISVWYTRIADNNKVSLQQARKLLDAKELAEFKWTVEEYIKYGEENALNGKWIKQLENASARVHISRLDALKLQMQQSVEVLYGNRVDDVDALLRRIYTDSYYHTAFEIQRGINVGWNLHTLDTSKVDTALLRPWTADGKTFSSRIWTHQAELLDTVQTELVQSLIRGTPPAAAINAIKNRFKVSRGKAARLVHTESAYASAEAQKEMYLELGVEQYEIVATLDHKTSEICQSMDGVVLPVSEFQPGVTANPFHPSCRTTTIPHYDDNYGERAARGEDGKTYYVPSDMKYKEWAETFVGAGKISDEKDLKSSVASAILNTGGGLMFILPRVDEANIPIEKMTKYALDPIKSRGKSVAFQEVLGYNITNADLLVKNILSNLRNYPAEHKGDKGYGETYSVLMELVGANGRIANVLTAWIDDKETGEMRLTSAYVKKRKGDSK